MATNDETFRLILAIQGEDQVDKLAAQAALAEQKLRSLIDSQKGMGAASVQGSAGIQAAAASLGKYQKELGEAEKSLAKLGGGRGRNSGTALMEISRAAEDAQYGLNGVLNNLPGLVTALGGGAGLTGVVSLAAVGAYQLYKNWDTLAGIFGAEHIKTAAEEMDLLRKATSLTADEAVRLSQADALKSKTKELQAGKSKEEKATEDAVTAAINEAGNENVVRFLGSTEEGRAMIDEQGEAGRVKGLIAAKEKQRDKLLSLAASGNDTSGAAASQAARLDAEIKAMTTGKDSELERARELTKQDKVSQTALMGEFGRKPLDDMIALLERNSGTAPEGLLDSLLAATPEGRKGKKEEDEDRKADEAAEQFEQNFKAKLDKDIADRADENDKDEEKRLVDEARRNEKAYDDRVKVEKEESKARLDAPGLDEFIKGEIMAGADEGDLGGMLRDLGFSEEEAAGLLDKGAKGALEASLKGGGGQASSSQTLQGGASLAAAIQSGVTNAPDLAKQQLDRLNAAVGYLQRIAEQRPDFTARTT